MSNHTTRLPDGTMADLASLGPETLEAMAKIEEAIGDKALAQKWRQQARKARQPRVDLDALTRDLLGPSSLEEEQAEQRNGSGTGSEPMTSTVPLVADVPLPREVPEGEAQPPQVPLEDGDLGRLLAETERTLMSYLWFPSEHYSLVLSLLIAVTYSDYPTAPYVLLHSPEQESGKSATLDVLGALVRNPLQVGDTSVSALFRGDGRQRPTWLLDEVGKLLAGDKERAAQVSSILNQGYRNGPGSRVARVERNGDKHERTVFDTFGPKVMASLESLEHIGDLLSRTVVLEMARKPSGIELEPVLPSYLGEELQPLRSEWASRTDALAALFDRQGFKDLLKRYSKRLQSGRLAETWGPMLDVASKAGGDWLDRAEAAADYFRGIRATAGLADHQQLVRDTWAILHERGDDRIDSETLIDELVALGEEHPWAAMFRFDLNRHSQYEANCKCHDGPKRKVAKLFDNYGINPQKVRIGERTPRGYTREALLPIVERYHPDLLERGGKPDKVNQEHSGIQDTREEVSHVPGTPRGSATSATSGTPQVSDVESAAEAEQEAEHRSVGGTGATSADVGPRMPDLRERVCVCVWCGYQARMTPRGTDGVAPCPKCRHAMVASAEKWARLSSKPLPAVLRKAAS